jgi:hypothetical protein
MRDSTSSTSTPPAAPNIPRPPWVDVLDLLRGLLSHCPDDKDLEGAILRWCLDFDHYTGIGDVVGWVLPCKGIGYIEDARKETKALRVIYRSNSLSHFAAGLHSSIRHETATAGY